MWETLETFAGVVVVALSAAALWYFLPRKGKVHPWVVAPYLESLIPLAIMMGFTLGLAAIGAVTLPALL
jgi:hypothetical protein